MFAPSTLFYQQVLAQQPKDKNKIYSLHEPDVYVIAKGKVVVLIPVGRTRSLFIKPQQIKTTILKEQQANKKLHKHHCWRSQS
jgi:IS5 family transposase